MPRTRRSSLFPPSSSPLKLDPISELSTDEDDLMDQSLRGMLPSSPFKRKRTSVSRKVDAYEDALGDESLERMAWAEAEKQADSASHAQSPPVLAALSPNVEMRKRRTPKKSKGGMSASSPSDAQSQPHSSSKRRKRSLPSLLDFSPKRRKSARISGELVITPPQPEEKPSELLRLMGKTPTPAKPNRGRPSSQATAVSLSAARLANPAAATLMYDVFSSSPLRQVTDVGSDADQEDDSIHDEVEEDPTVTLCPGPITRATALEQPPPEVKAQPQPLDEMAAGILPKSRNTRPVSKLASPVRRSRGDVRTSTQRAALKVRPSPGRTRLPTEAAEQPGQVQSSEKPKKTSRSPARTTARSEFNPSLKPRETTLRQSPVGRAASNPQSTAQQAVSKPSLARTSPVQQKAIAKAHSSPKAASTTTRAIAEDACPGPSQTRSPTSTLAKKAVQDDDDQQREVAQIASPPAISKAKLTRSVDGSSAQLLKDALRGSKSTANQFARPSAIAVTHQTVQPKMASSAAGKSRSWSPVQRRAERSRPAPRPEQRMSRSPEQPKVSVLTGRSPKKQADKASPVRVLERSQPTSSRSVSPAKSSTSPMRGSKIAATTAEGDVVSASQSPVVAPPQPTKDLSPTRNAKSTPRSTESGRQTAHADAAIAATSSPSIKTRVAAKKAASPAKVKSSSAQSSTTVVKSRSPKVDRDAKASSVRNTQQKSRTVVPRSKESTKAAPTTKEIRKQQIVPEGFRLTSTGSLVHIAPTLSKGDDLPFATSAAHQAKLQQAIEEEERIRKERSQVKAHTVPGYLKQRREELEKERELDLQREIEFIRQQEQGSGASTSSKRNLPESLMGTRPRSTRGNRHASTSDNTAAVKPFVSSLEARHQERQAWEAKRKAREELLEHERRKARAVREKREEEALKLERERRVVKAHPVPEHIYGKRRSGVSGSSSSSET